MKTLMIFVLLVISAASARADWKTLKEGQEKAAALQTVGVPLLMSKSRSGLQETWTYDSGGYILFERGRVRYWEAPKPVVRVKLTRAVPVFPGTRLAKN
jgi:hypothetical protein